MMAATDRRVSSRSMCEHFIARAAEPFRLDELWPFTEKLERFGLAGFGWGAAWLDDRGRSGPTATSAHSATIPGARPSARPRPPPPSSTCAGRRASRRWTLPDTQPFDDPAGRFAFSHNGDLRDYKHLRATYRAAGRIHGRADTEVGERWLEDEWQPDVPPGSLLAALHERFGGPANLAVLAADGTAHHYAGNDENPVFAFRLGRIGIASTGIYSLDRSLFRFVAPAARRIAGSFRDDTTVRWTGMGFRPAGVGCPQLCGWSRCNTSARGASPYRPARHQGA